MIVMRVIVGATVETCCGSVAQTVVVHGILENRHVDGEQRCR